MTITTCRQAPEAPAADPRAVWLCDVRWLLGITEAHPALPLPHSGPREITFYLDTWRNPAAPRVLADAEAILSSELGVTFTPDLRADSPSWYVLAATLGSGLKVAIRASLADVATRNPLVTGNAEWWVRIPAGAAA